MGEILKSGIDAFSVTSCITGENRTAARIAVSELADWLQTEYFYAEPVKPFSAAGLKGWARGSLRYGTMWKNGVAWYNSCVVTGPMAERAAEAALTYESDIKVTRIDFAVDVEINKPLPGFAAGVFAKNSQWDKSLRLIRSATGDTIYKNSRESGRFGRCYDKSKAYELPLGKVWRYEIEFKKIDAKKAYETVRKADYLPKTIETSSRAVWNGWNIPFQSDGEFSKLLRVEASAVSDLQRFEWVCSISGAIRSLAERGYEDKIREVLNLPIQLDFWGSEDKLCLSTFQNLNEGR